MKTLKYFGLLNQKLLTRCCNTGKYDQKPTEHGYSDSVETPFAITLKKV